MFFFILYPFFTLVEILGFAPNFKNANTNTVKLVYNGYSQKYQKLVLKTDYSLVQVESILLSTFIKLPFVIKILFLSFFEWPLKTGFTLCI